PNEELDGDTGAALTARTKVGTAISVTMARTAISFFMTLLHVGSRSERCASDTSGCSSRVSGFSRRKWRSHHILLQQIERYSQQNHILHQERDVARHRRKPRSWIPAVRHEWNNGDGR